MSYLDTPRLAFSGRFQVDVSTINNDVRLYDVSTFKPSYQTLSIDGRDGGWNPDGTGTFRLVGCTIGGARLGEEPITTPEQDPVIGMALENADDRVFGKLCDLDPQQQMASQIWGMRLRLAGAGSRGLFAGDYKPAAFTDLWRRQQTTVFLDQALAATFQSVLEGVTWEGDGGSRVLAALREAGEENCLSVSLNVYGYARDPASPRYTLGECTGSIGPFRRGEPRHFVFGRHLLAPLQDPTDPTVPTGDVYGFACRVSEDGSTLAADFGNCLPIVDGGGQLADVGDLFLAAVAHPAMGGALLSRVEADSVALLGTVNYREDDWYARSGGVQDFPVGEVAVADRALLLLRPATGRFYEVLAQETLAGYHVRPDDTVCRIDPGETVGVDLFAARYGRPIEAVIACAPKLGMMGGTGVGTDPLDPPVPTPAIAVPPEAILYPPNRRTDAVGHARFSIRAAVSGPDGTRGYIDGQLYGIGFTLFDAPANAPTNFWDFVSVLAFDALPMPDAPTWYRDVHPIMRQYSNLYPIMGRRMFDLADYDAVVAHRKLLTLAFSLPERDPNHMPVTRDLSRDKRAMILAWLDRLGQDGQPLKGNSSDARPQRPPKVVDPTVPVTLDPRQARGKSGVVVAYRARSNQGGQS